MLIKYPGSEQSKKRKRQDSTKNTQGEDITQSVPKPRKKAKVGGQTEGDINDDKESTGRKGERNMHARINERNDSRNDCVQSCANKGFA